MSIWLSINSDEIEPSFWFTAVALLCVLDSLLFFYNFFNYIRKYVADQRHAQAGLAAGYDNPNYGAP
ncbi:hypothetical protein WR25_26692 [Diploscapter pachys]|uniref:Uncharacterized protein n=1 Tax=Diploscapter pachys TaxID=2018661 RepID=A0A2A2L8V1_9BILA|nr:hypothetical protein WR25_26692 [Diploscapter pachys]